MDDKRLLELAAKAAGIELKWDGYSPYRVKRSGNLADWNPLTDDGDALRLAVKLQLSPTIDNGYTVVWNRHGPLSTNEWAAENGDAAYATRRAIVRAAAVIGERHG